MTVKQMAVVEGRCPICTGHTDKIGDFINDSCINKSARVEYYSCRNCKKVWEWTTGSLGVEIIDMKMKKKHMQDDIGSAS
jgi:hypothetical protein